MSYAMDATEVSEFGFLHRCHSARNDLISACRNPRHAQDRVLNDILAGNRLTGFGRQHDFSKIRTIDDYRRAVPISTYDKLAPWIHRVIAGERDALTGDAPYMFLKTSGTTGPSKAILQTRDWRLNYRSPAIYAQWATYAKYHPYIFSHSHSVMDLSWEREEPRQTLGALPYQAITHRPHALDGGDWMPPWYDDPWFSYIGNDIGYLDRIYSRLRHFIGHDLRCIVSVNPSTILALKNHLASNTARLIRDVRDGTLFGERLFRPDPELASSLEERVGDGPARPRDIWPNLNLLVCWRSASAALYGKQLVAGFPDAELLPFSTTGTEGVVTIPVDRHPVAGVLAVNQGIYEFVPCDDPSESEVPDDADTVLPSDLELGRTYHLIMTQANGLYRYMTGDLYRVVGTFAQTPRLEFVGRAGRTSSFTGEKLTESQVSEAVERSLNSLGLADKTFTCCPVWGEPPHYTFVIEPDRQWPDDRIAVLETTLDRQLGQVNSEYNGKRDSGRLGPASLVVALPGTFQRYWDMQVCQGVSGSQVKHHWLQGDSRIIDNMKNLGLLAVEEFVGGALHAVNE